MLLYVEQKMIYELRTYQVVPGKMAELKARYDNYRFLGNSYR